MPILAGAVTAVMPRAWEETLGDIAYERLAPSLAADRRSRCTGPARRALDALFTRLAAAAGGGYAYRLDIVAAPMVNAFALPGGRIVVFEKLIGEMEDPAELAGVLAHEMAHVVARDGTRSLVRSFGLGLVFDLMMGGMGAGVMGAVGQNLLALSYSRAVEAEADRMAGEILVRAGLSGAGLARFLAHLAETRAGKAEAPEFLSSHPSPEHRRQAVSRARAGSGDAGLNDAQWSLVKATCAGPPSTPRD